ncbi:MAG: beta strand repeat-containing protein [Nitrospirota bacterium]
MGAPAWALPPEPVVAVHVSELTQALETMPATPPTPSGTAGTTGFQWWVEAWHYFVMPESLKESLRSDGTPFVEVSDADIAAGALRHPDGTPRYPIVISLAAEAVANNQITPLLDYVASGGTLFVGSSAFTRNPDGTTRGDFAFGNEMGLHMVNASLQNWYENRHFTKLVDHRLVSHIPSASVSWRMPHNSDEIPLGVSPRHAVHPGNHFVFQVTAAGATVIANGDSGPLLATRPYGMGRFVYHGAMQPLIGHGVYDPAMYAYLMYRRAIEWAFESTTLPIVRLSPWQFPYNAALIVRHDFENSAPSIRSIESSAAFERAQGAKGDYYFTTGTLREEMPDRDAVIASMRRAVTDSGATIGPHNGGLRNPVNLNLNISDFDYWHWGPDEALDVTPPGYASGKAYALESVQLSFQDIAAWLIGVDNGRVGCGLLGNCPRTWAAPYFNSTREDSYDLLDSLGALTSGKGEQKLGPFPHWTISYRTYGKRYHVSIPASDWFVGTEIPGALEWGHTTASMQAAVDFHYDLGGAINLYGHIPSTGTNLMGQYVTYAVAKPRMWATNTVEMADWWITRSTAVVTPTVSITGNLVRARATLSGATDPETSVDVALPSVSNFQVLINDAPANASEYRVVGNVVRVRVGTTASSVEVQYAIDNPVPATTGLSPASATAGGAGFTLTVNGSGFMMSSVVRWNGTDRPTTYVSATQLSAQITAGDIAAAGTVPVTVFTPAPGGGTSNPWDFAIDPPQAQSWTQTDWAGGGGQAVWADSSRFDSAAGINAGVAGQITLSTSTAQLFSDDFTRPGGAQNPLAPWVSAMGTWTVTNGVMQGTGGALQYAYAMLMPETQWADYSVQGRIQMPTGSFGGGIGGRVNAATGAHYGAWVYPSGSGGGSNVLKLWKFRGWTDIGPGAPMQQISVPTVGTAFHTVQLTFTGNRIQVYYDGVLRIDVTDNNFDGRAPLTSGGISADWYTGNPARTIVVDDVSVVGLSVYGSGGTLVSSGFDGGAGVQWQNVSWDATTGTSTDVCVRTRGADSSGGLALASWSACYGNSGAGFMSENRQWIQYQAELTSTDQSATPVFREIRISFSFDNSVPVTTAVTPATATVGDAGVTLTVAGSGFVAGSVVQWNGVDRPTTFVSSIQLTAAIPAADLMTAGTAMVTVFSPAPGGGTSNPQTFTVLAPNPVPTTTTISPSTANVGDAAFTLTVDGADFLTGSTVQWNGLDRPTTYVSPTQLTAAIPAADLATGTLVSVTVVNPAPGGGTSNAQTFTINNPAPVTTSLNPNTATAGDGVFTLTVNGSGFVAASVVHWEGVDRPTTFVSANQVTALVSSEDIATAGAAAVTVVTPAPGGGTSNAQTFVINNLVPSTTALTPASATAGDAALTLTVNGTGFAAGSTVQWNGVDRATTFVSAMQVTAAIEAADVATAGTALVTVVNPAPGGGASNAQTFTINPVPNPVPSTTTLTPSSATAGDAAFTLTVDGADFVSGAVVRWNGVDRVTTFVSATQVTAMIDAADVATAGTASVTVVSPAPGGGTSNVQTFTINNPVPATTAVTPAVANAGDAAFTLTVDGTGFVAGSVVQWNGVDRVTTFVSAIQLAAAIPASDIAAAGAVSVTVVNAAPGGGASNAQTFTINTPASNPVPTTTSLTPATATAGDAAFTLTIDGSGFVAGSVAQWNGVDRPTTVLSASQVTAQIAAEDIASAGTALVTVVNAAPGGGASNAQTFTINPAPNPVPTTTALTPASATAGDAAFTLTVDGTGFVSGAVVQWNGVGRTTTVVSPTQVTAEILAADVATAGTASVTVVNPAPGGGASNAQTFTINPVPNPIPTTTALTPATATAGDAAFILIVDGANFVSGAVVQWNGADRVTTLVSPIQVTAMIDAADVATAGTASVTVVNPAPGGGASNAQTFAINPAPNPIPAITSLTPSSVTEGAAAFTLTVDGAEFVPGAVVQWNGADRVTTLVSPIQVTAMIDAADVATASTASVTVVNPAPGGGASNAQTFTINVAPTNPVPTTGSLSPTEATAGSAAFTLTVTGTDFVAGAVVRWNGVDRATTVVSATQVTAEIVAADIADAGTASVTVVNPAPGGGTSNAQTFTINAPPDPLLFSDDFTRAPGTPNPLSPWVAALGTWNVANGEMQGSAPASRQYSYAYYSTTPQWADYTVQGRIQMPAGSFGGGIGGRVNPTTGAHYGAWVYPTGSAGGSNVLKLWKFRGWTDLGPGVPMQQVSIPTVGTGSHTLQLTFTGNGIQVYYDGVLRIDVTDNNFDARAPLLSGGISADWWTGTAAAPSTIVVDDISVVTP